MGNNKMKYICVCTMGIDIPIQSKALVFLSLLELIQASLHYQQIPGTLSEQPLKSVTTLDKVGDPVK